MALTPPFVNYRSVLTKNINSTPTIVFSSQYGCHIPSIRACNTGNNDMVVTIWILGERNNELFDDLFLEYRRLVAPNTSIVVSETITEPGDIIYAKTDFVGDTMDVIASVREFNELT